MTKPKPGAIRPVAKNRKAFHDYEVLEKLEAGLVLLGTEVKSLRQGQVAFNDAYAREKQGEMWLVDLHIAAYTHGGYVNHTPLRPRKLLLHRREITKLAQKTDRQGLTLVPLEVYFKDGKAKVELGVCRGRKKGDKREAAREKADKREMERARKTR